MMPPAEVGVAGIFWPGLDRRRPRSQARASARASRLKRVFSVELGTDPVASGEDGTGPVRRVAPLPPVAQGRPAQDRLL